MAQSAHDAAASADRLEQVLELLRTRVADGQRATLEAFVRRYFGQVDPEDLAEREPADLYGAALSHWNFAHRREPGQVRLRAFNLTIAEHGWQSTHTVLGSSTTTCPSRRLGDDGGQPPRPDAAPPHPSPVGVARADGLLQARRTARAHHESFIHVEVDRVRNAAALEALAPTWNACWATCARPCRLGADPPARRHRAEIDATPPPIPRRTRARRAATFLAWLCRQSLHLPGLPGPRTRHRPGRAAHPSGVGPRAPPCGILRETEAQVVAFAALPPELRAHARRPELLVVTKSTARSTVHRPATSTTSRSSASTPDGRDRRGARFLGLFTSTAYSASPPTSRCCGARSPTSSSAPAPPPQPCRQGAAQHPRDLPARRAVPDQHRRPPAHATGILHLASASAHGCSCDATRSSDSCPASSTRRARTTPPRPAARNGRRS